MLRLGLTAFGGPAAHIALLRQEVVERRKWLEEQEFLDFLAASGLIPGPTSTELVLHAGMARAGTAGLWVAGLCFTLPAVLVTTLLAVAYVEFRAVPGADSLLAGLRPGLLVVVLGALAGLARAALRTLPLGAMAAGALTAAMVRLPEIPTLLGCGLLGIVLRTRSAVGLKASALPLLAAAWPGLAGLTPGPGGLFLYFLLIGSTLFGSGYLLISYLEAGLVHSLGWLTRQELMDAVAAGQVTPGPLFSTAAFVGYLVAGWPGAAAAAVGIFAPAFLAVSLTHGFAARLRASPAGGGFLDGVNAATVGLMAGVTLLLGREALADPRSWLILGAAALVQWRFRWSGPRVLGLSAGLGWLLWR